MQADIEFEKHIHGHSVLIVCFQQTFPDQAERRAREVAEALRRQGYEVVVETLLSKLTKKQDIRNWSLLTRLFSVARNWRQVLTAIRRCDVVQVNIDLSSSPLVAATILLAVSGFLGKQTVLSLASVGPVSLSGVRGHFVRRMIRLANVVSTGSDKAARILAQVKSNITVIPPSNHVGESDRGARQNAIQPRVGVVAPIDRYSLAMLLRGIALTKQKYPRAELAILTDPGNTRKIGLSSAELSRSGVEIVVCESEHQMMQALQSCDLYFDSSAQCDPSPMLIEACTRGIPVLHTDLTGNSGLVEHGISGLVIEAGNHVDYANRLCELVESPELVKTLSQNGRRVAERFDPKLTEAAWLESYSSLANVGVVSPKPPRRVSPQFQPAVKS